MKLLKSIADRVLGSLAPSAKAGACVPNAGDRCCVRYGSCGCVQYGWIQCTGVCR